MSTYESTRVLRHVRNLPWPCPEVIDDIPMTDSTAGALPYGSWPSPITAADVARHARLFNFPIAASGAVWWQELRADEKGRTTVVRLGADGQRRVLLPAPWDARSRVHEYGGRSYLP